MISERDSPGDEGWIKHPNLWKFAEGKVLAQEGFTRGTPLYWLKVKEEYERTGGQIVCDTDLSEAVGNDLYSSA